MDLKHKTGMFILSLMVVTGGFSVAWCQDFYTRDIIDTPTAGLLPRGSYMVSLRAYPKGEGYLFSVGGGSPGKDGGWSIIRWH